MDFKKWIDLFGCKTDDKRLRDALAKAGITKTPQIARDETSVAEDISGEGITLVFIDETFLNRQALVEGPAVLSEIRLILQHPKMKDLYKGPLPFNLNLESSQFALRKRFGTPIESNDKFRWDRWEIDSQILTVVYSKDLSSLNRVVVGLPLAE